MKTAALDLPPDYWGRSSAAEITQLFDQLYADIETNSKASAANKEDLKAEVREIQSTVTEAAQKNEKVEQGFLLLPQ